MEKVTLKLKNNKEVNLVIKYQKLFEFMGNYKNSKDLIQVVSTKNTVDHETIMQLIYVAYLGGNNEEPIIKYEEFLDLLDFDMNRDMTIFSNLIGVKQEKN